MSDSAGIRAKRDKLASYLSFKLTKRNSIAFILIFMAVVVTDSTIVKFYAYSGVQLPTSWNVGIFVMLSVFYSVTGIILINSVSRFTSKYVYNLPLNLKYFRALILATQISVISVIIVILLQMMFFNRYSIYLLQGVTYLTHISALIFMVLLVLIFISWLKSRKNYIILLFIISFALVSVNIIVSLLYLESQFYAASFNYVRPHAIHNVIVSTYLTPWSELLASIFDILSLSSFLTIWMATITLLYQYRFKVGKIRYFVVMSIPLIYYLVPLQDYFGNVFSPLILSEPITFGVIYVLIFSATKQIGALLFSLAFWTASSLVTNERVRISLLTSAIGMALLFGSIEIVTLQYKIYPPFGLVTEAFMPLGAYLLFIGIFTSATSVARDAKLRKEFYKSAMSQFNLLKTIGVTQMEKELLNEYKPILARSNELEEPQYQPLEQSDVKEIIHDVLNELQSRENLFANKGQRMNDEK